MPSATGSAIAAGATLFEAGSIACSPAPSTTHAESVVVIICALPKEVHGTVSIADHRHVAGQDEARGVGGEAHGVDFTAGVTAAVGCEVSDSGDGRLLKRLASSRMAPSIATIGIA